MDRRPSLRYGHLVVSLMLLAATVAAGGCASALATAVWLIKGPNMPAEYDGLRGKKVVVVCRPFSSSLYANPGVAKDISRQVSLLLKQQVRGIEVMVDAFEAATLATRGADGRTRFSAHVRAHLGALFEHCGIDPTQRPEALSPEQYVELANLCGRRESDA